MFQPRDIKSPVFIKNDLQILINRLESAIYEEDKVSSLAKIHEYSSEYPEIVANTALYEVLLSLPELNECAIQYKIARELLDSTYRDEILETLCADRAKAEKIISCIFKLKGDKAYRFTKAFKCSKFYAILAEHPDASSFVAILIQANCLELIVDIIAQNYNLISNLVFSGMVEILLDKLEYKTESLYLEHKVRTEAFQLLLYIARKSHIVQNYFVENEYHKFLFKKIARKSAEADITSEILEYDLLSCILDSSNESYMTNQLKLYDNAILGTAIKNKRYIYIYLVIRNNRNLVLAFEDAHKELIIQEFRARIESDEASEEIIGRDGFYKLVYEICKYIMLDIPENILISIIFQRKNENIENSLISLPSIVRSDYLLYILLMCDGISIIQEQLLKSFKKEMPTYCYPLVVLILYNHGIEIPDDKYKIYNSVTEFRRYIVAHGLLTSEVGEMLINCCSEMLQNGISIENNLELTANIEQTSNQAKDSPAGDEKETKQAETDTKIYNLKEMGLKGITSALNLFKRHYNNDESSFGL
ncbi:hypothetical protein ENBRE01_1721 [Enteropsectra breve]|nr:hypothetical protein ENBRE01_1017 [Enteropsectra breve]KAI5150805.1 hypothetical protein ENBRE01_1721 [Enteropsectra breve]